MHCEVSIWLYVSCLGRVCLHAKVLRDLITAATLSLHYYFIGSNCCSVTVLVSLSSFITVCCNYMFLTRNAHRGAMRGVVVCGVFLWTAVCSDVTEQSENLSQS